jgi:TadE-like protein
LKLDHRDEGTPRADSRLRQRLGRTRRDRESGQAMVEFALILFPLLLLVAGIVQFGIALNYWLDMQRLANQGARWAAVNSYPGCPSSGPNTPCSPSLQLYIACQPVANALKPGVTISMPDGDTRGKSVVVELKSTFDLVPLLGVKTIDLKAKATMRLEQAAGRFASNATEVKCP